tara:strand:+ start:2093 stop:2254 length:162 start_codon:yes stop_codon:yes gene_type:complete
MTVSIVAIEGDSSLVSRRKDAGNGKRLGKGGRAANVCGAVAKQEVVLITLVGH